MVSTFTEDVRFELVPNTYYPQASDRPPLTINRVSNGTQAVTDLIAGTLDMAFHIPVSETSRVTSNSGTTLQSFNAGYQYMMWHNIRRAPCSNLNVRQAIDLALDRTGMTTAVGAGSATRNFFPSNTPYYVSELDTNLGGDATAAGALLDTAGYTLNSTGTRVDSNGNPLSLTLVAYPQRPSLVASQPTVAANLRDLGIVVTEVVTSANSWDELDTLMAAYNYDLLMWAQHTLPAGDPQFFINAFFRTGAGNNHAGLTSPTIDSLIDDLAEAEGEADRVAATEAAETGILDQAPVSILFTPVWYVGLGSRMANYEPYGSDYYVIHADVGLPSMGQQSCEPASNPTSSGAERMMFGGLSIVSLLLMAFVQ
jgi:peptide/nickel transport system substrate-binding protein